MYSCLAHIFEQRASVMARSRTCVSANRVLSVAICLAKPSGKISIRSRRDLPAWIINIHKPIGRSGFPYWLHYLIAFWGLITTLAKLQFRHWIIIPISLANGSWRKFKWKPLGLNRTQCGRKRLPFTKS